MALFLDTFQVACVIALESLSVIAFDFLLPKIGSWRSMLLIVYNISTPGLISLIKCMYRIQYSFCKYWLLYSIVAMTYVHPGICNNNFVYSY